MRCVRRLLSARLSRMRTLWVPEAGEAGQGEGGQAGPQLTLLRHHPQQRLDPGLDSDQ